MIVSQKNNLVLILLSALFILLYGKCDIDKGKKPPTLSQEYKIPPPPLSKHDQDLCDSLKNFAYDRLRKNSVIVVFNDTISDKIRYLKFLNIFHDILKFDYYKTYDINNAQTRSFKTCVQPIMDSFIFAKYGPHAKDSIINKAYSLVK